MGLSEAQDACLKLIGLSGQWNEFDGPAIEAALRGRQDLWRSALFASETIPTPQTGGLFGLGRRRQLRLRDTIDLIVLRDLPKGLVTLSTLFLLAVPCRQDELYSLANGWGADEVYWIDQEEAFDAMGESPQHDPVYASDPARVILRCWWD